MSNTLVLTCIMMLTFISCKSNMISSSLTEGSEPSCTSEKLKELKAQLIIAKSDAQASVDPVEKRSFDHASALPYEQSSYTKNFFEPYFGLSGDAYHECMQKAKEAASKACEVDATCSSASAIMKEHSAVWTKTYEETKKSCLASSDQGGSGSHDSLTCDFSAIHSNSNLEGVCKSPYDGQCYHYSGGFVEHNKPTACPDTPSSTEKAESPKSGEKVLSVAELEERIKQCEAALAKSQPKPAESSQQPKQTEQSAGSETSAQSGQLDCWKDYSKIRSSSSAGVCRNSSSGICYRYGSGDVKYDQGAVQCSGAADSNSPSKASAANEKPTSTSPSSPSSSMLDCNSDYSKIRAGGSGICKNPSSGFCYKYGNNDVLYDQGQVSCQ